MFSLVSTGIFLSHLGTSFSAFVFHFFHFIVGFRLDSLGRKDANTPLRFGFLFKILTMILHSGPNTTISAISIGSHVHIGANCILHPFVIIKDNVKILPNTVVPTQMVIPSGSVVGGRPARVVGEVGEGWGVSAGAAGGGGMGGVGGGEVWVEGGDLRELVRCIK